MITKLSKWGNSLAIRLPNKYLKESNFKENESIEVIFENDQIILKPIKNKKMRMTMAELTKGMTREGVLDQYEEWGQMGKEEM